MAICILPVVRRDLQNFKEYWNTHHIRPSRRAYCPSGRPDDMFEMPQVYGNFFLSLVHKPYSLFLGGDPCLQTMINGRIFFQMCDMLVNHVDVNNASHTNCFTVYKYLVNNIIE